MILQGFLEVASGPPYIYMVRLGSGRRCCESSVTRPLAVTGSCDAALSWLALSVEVKYGIAGLLLVAFGPAYLSVLLHPLYGQRWSKIAAPRALAVDSPYFMLLLVKGRQITMMQQDPSQSSLLRFDMCLQGCWR